MNQRLDTGGGKVRLELSARRRQHRKEVIDVALVEFVGNDEGRTGETLPISTRDGARRSVHCGRNGSRARRIAACTSSRREFAPASRRC